MALDEREASSSCSREPSPVNSLPIVAQLAAGVADPAQANAFTRKWAIVSVVRIVIAVGVHVQAYRMACGRGNSAPGQRSQSLVGQDAYLTTAH